MPTATAERAAYRRAPIFRDFLYANEAARLARVSRSTILHWCTTGVLPGRWVVGRWRIDPRDLERLLEGTSPARK